MGAPSPAEQVHRLLGPTLTVATPRALAPFALEGQMPAVAALPETPQQVADLLAMASAQGWGVVPWGSGGGMDGGAPPQRYDLAVSLTRQEQLLDHDQDNLTLTAQAGLTLGEANRRLHPAHQFLALGLPGDRATLGGIIAANRHTPKRLLYGDVRDMLLGLVVAMPDGKVVRYGRKVIKNVAGYDMNKLFLGSQGMLGVIVEATFKLFALPDEEGLLLGRFAAPEAAAQAAGALLASPLLPAGLWLLDAPAAQSFSRLQGLPDSFRGVLLLVAFEGRRPVLRRQLEGGNTLMISEGAQECEALGGLTDPAWRFLMRPEGEEESPKEATIRLRVGVAPSQVGSWLTRLAVARRTFGLSGMAVADCASGSLRAQFEISSEIAFSPLVAWIGEVRSGLAREGGYVVVDSAPTAFKKMVHVWGSMGGEGEIMALLKARLDPGNVMAPGRFLPLP